MQYTIYIKYNKSFDKKNSPLFLKDSGPVFFYEFKTSYLNNSPIFI